MAVGAGEGRAEEDVEAAVSYCFVATHGRKVVSGKAVCLPLRWLD